eukprot:m.190219 g.190219  ORF g.190219 m.190219 type:complete len:59 (+) comp16753_c3_seq1:244-420(+)
MMNRDIDAAYKIGARFLAKQENRNLGTSDRKVKDITTWLTSNDNIFGGLFETLMNFVR